MMGGLWSREPEVVVAIPDLTNSTPGGDELGHVSASGETEEWDMQEIRILSGFTDFCNLFLRQ